MGSLSLLQRIFPTQESNRDLLHCRRILYQLRYQGRLKRSLVFPTLLFSSISLHWSLRKAFLSLHAILWNFAFKQVYLSFSPLPFASLFTAICKASSDSHFAFWHFFFWGMVLIPVSCTMSRTSVHSSSGTLSIRANPLNLLHFHCIIVRD